ncbi:uncharacterized protein C8orf34 homolog [Physella acuta]|uniref:uncharacterized protein C8orf34 homolog n=1 Tax=Physella acuta TaxID=109671 RepID=UPI0027DDB9C0|nr:uncharacterized protein C8orf34 homolog [Physella acuta]
MASQSRINTYMERHKIGALFEDLMNKVIRDMPEEPMIYLLRAVYKKAGMEIPQGIRYGGLRKSTSELKRSTSPERLTRSAQVSSSADLGASRDYEKPWATTTAQRIKPRKLEETSASKNKPEWNSDKKVKASTFDDLFEAGDVPKKDKENVDTRKSTTKQKGGWGTGSQGVKTVNAWATVGMDEGEVYSSPTFQSTKRPTENSSFSEKDLLCNETIPLSMRSGPNTEDDQSTRVSVSSHNSKNRKMEAKKHKEEYGQLLTKADHKSDDSGLGPDFELAYDDDDDAIELLENADDLKREGVKNIPLSGYKLSRNLRHRDNEPRVKVNINVNPPPYPYRTYPESVDHYDVFETETSSPELKDSDEEDFESVSQVSGPRHPVWDVPDTDAESLFMKPSYSSQAPKKSSLQQKTFSEKTLRNTTPVKFADRSLDNADELSVSNETWTETGNTERPAKDPRVY